jgi:penicillin-binding protein 2
MEAQTGKVLTIVNQDWAVRAPIKPCSTIKLVTGVAGLNEGVINKENGAVRNVSTRRGLDDALAFSDNPYFQRVGSQIGSQKTIEYAKALGLGEPTGLNTEGEAAGKLPYGNEHAKIYSHGNDFEVTGLQLAVMVSAITNGGHRVLPRVPRTKAERSRFQPFYRANIEFPQQNLRRVIPGMMGAAEYGTARRGVDQSLGIAGKTGSCIGRGSWVGLFASVAPIERPKYSVVVITRGQRERGKYAAAVAGQIYSALRPHIVRTNTNLAQTEFHLQPKNKVEVQTAAKMADLEGEDDEEMAAADDGSGVIVVPSVPRKDPAKLVTKTGDAKPLFAPVVISPGKKP